MDGYDGFLTNYGDHFSLSTGIFSAPREGIFEFFTAIPNVEDGMSLLTVEKNNVKQLEFLQADDYQTLLSFTWIIELKKGDTVRLKVSYSNQNDRGLQCTETSNCIFNGKFIRNI